MFEKAEIYDDENKNYVSGRIKGLQDDLVIYTIPTIGREEQYTSIENVIFLDRTMVKKSNYVNIYFLRDECSYNLKYLNIIVELTN